MQTTPSLFSLLFCAVVAGCAGRLPAVANVAPASTLDRALAADHDTCFESRDAAVCARLGDRLMALGRVHEAKQAYEVVCALGGGCAPYRRVLRRTLALR